MSSVLVLLHHVQNVQYNMRVRSNKKTRLDVFSIFLCTLQEVLTATLDLEDVRSYRGERCHPHMVRGHFQKRSRFTTKYLCYRICCAPLPPSLQEYEYKPYERIKVDFSLSDCKDTFLPTHQAVDWTFHTPEEEIRCVRVC